MKKKESKVEDVVKSIDSLAQMTAKGFERMDQRFEKADQRSATLWKEMSRMNDDIHDIKTNLGPLVRMAGQQDREIQNLKLRMSRVEAKLQKI